MADRIEQAKLDFADLYGQVVWLADRLSEARILVGHKTTDTYLPFSTTTFSAEIASASPSIVIAVGMVTV